MTCTQGRSSGLRFFLLSAPSHSWMEQWQLPADFVPVHSDGLAADSNGASLLSQNNWDPENIDYVFTYNKKQDKPI